SILQRSANTLSQSELKNITYDKGGSSTYLYRTILFNSLIINEKDAIYSLGYVLQLINDMFDLHKDYHSKQQSLFTTNNDIDVPIAAYNSAIDDFILKFGKLSYPKEFKMQFFNLIAIILGRGHVCRDMLLNLAKSSKKKDLREMDRHLLICDMEKATNIYKSINLSYKLGKRFNAEIL
ncbi:MAG: hypothetical protein RLZZ337_1979, partial [Bacteroidota bacterium]